MITKKKLDIYEKYGGLIDGYIFENGNLPNDELDLNDWSTIDELIGNIILLKSGNASDNLQSQLEEFIHRNTDNKDVVERLNEIAARRIQQNGLVS